MGQFDSDPWETVIGGKADIPPMTENWRTAYQTSDYYFHYLFASLCTVYCALTGIGAVQPILTFFAESVILISALNSKLQMIHRATVGYRLGSARFPNEYRNGMSGGLPDRRSLASAERS